MVHYRMSYILLWLEAPLQSWGVNSKFSRRSTMNFPTKSGILGIILSAMGKKGMQKDLLLKFADSDFQVDAFPQKGQLESSTLEDFHMVGSGYDESKPWENLLIPKTSDGKKPNNGCGAKLTYRHYLQDMAFCAFVEGTKDFLEEIGYALNNPVWPVFLGRKCCIPSELIFQGTFDNKRESICKALEIASAKGRYCSYSVIQENSIDKGDVLVLNDVPIQFGFRKLYKERYVTIVKNPYANNFS